MNPIAEHFYTRKSGKVPTTEGIGPLLNIDEEYKTLGPTNTDYGMIKYKMVATFGREVLIAESAVVDPNVNVLGSIRKETIKKLTREVYGKYITKLLDIRVDLYRTHQLDLAKQITEIIEDMEEV